MSFNYGFTCPCCGEYLEGDGYTTVFHCPNAEWDEWVDKEPDAEAVFCVAEEVQNASTS